MAFYKEDIVDINLNTGNIFRSFLGHSIGYKDDDADRFGIRAFRDGVPVDLSGASCQAIFMNPNGTNIALTSYGTVSGNVAYVTLPPACYDYEGQFCLAIKLVGDGVTGTVRIVDGTVTRTGASGAVAPTSSVPTYQEILSTYDAMVAATSAANLAIAETFDATKAYPAGKYVINEGHLYRLTADHAANVTWANTSKVATNFGDDLSSLKSAINDVCPEITKIFGTDIYNLANATQVKKTASYITVDTRSISMRTNGSVSNGIHVVFSAEHNTDYELVCLNPSGYTAKLKADTSIPSSYSNNNVGTSNKVNSGNNDYIIASFSIPKEQIDYYTFSSIALIKNSKIDLIEEIQTGLTKKATMLGYFANSTQAGTYNDLNQLPTGTFAIYAYSSGKVHAPTSTFTGAVLTLGGVLSNDGGGDFAPQLAIDRYGALYVRGRYSNYTDWFEIAKKSEIDAIMPLVNKALFASEVLKISNTTVDTSENRADGYFNTTGTLVANASGGAFYTPTSISIKAGQTIHAHAIGYQSSMSIITSGSSGNGSPLAISETDKTDYYYTAMGNMQIRVCCMNSFADSFYVEIVSSDIIETILEELHPNKYNIATFKRYGVCGDSLASGESAHNEGGTVGYVDLYDFSWVQFIARKTGNEAINFSKGGLNTSTWLTNSFGLTKLQNPDNKCDCYFIGLGVNDLSLGSEYLGSISDVNTSDPTQSLDSFYGNYAKIIGYIRQVQPKAIIFCITIPNPNDETLVASFNTAIQTVCSTLNCCLIELTDEDDAITSANKRWGHYNAWGYNQWAEIIMNHVNDYMSANPSKFRQIEFIGTDYSWNN